VDATANLTPVQAETEAHEREMVAGLSLTADDFDDLVGRIFDGGIPTIGWWRRARANALAPAPEPTPEPALRHDANDGVWPKPLAPGEEYFPP
jgi:hypothetical protein